jgi:hypothetical protein
MSCHIRRVTVMVTEQTLDQMRQTGDRLADGTVKAIFTKGGENIAEVEQLLKELINNDQVPSNQLPPEVSEYLEKSAYLPDWANLDLMEQGQKVFVDHFRMILPILGCVSLPESYVCADAAKVLATTAYLANNKPELWQLHEKHVHRRIMETLHYVLEVMSKGAFSTEGKGIRSTQKLRLMHSAIRHLLQVKWQGQGDQDWEDFAQFLARYSWEEDFVPINQEAMSAAILTFSYIVLRSLRKLRAELSSKDEEAYLHLWNVIGYLLGVHHELLPETMEEAEQLYDIIWTRHRADTEEGRMLTRVLIGYLESEVPLPESEVPIPLRRIPLRHTPRILMWALLDEKSAATLEGELQLDLLDRLARRRLLSLIDRLKGFREWSEDRLPLVRGLDEWYFRILVHKLRGINRGGNREPFDIPAELMKDWNTEEG